MTTDQDRTDYLWLGSSQLNPAYYRVSPAERDELYGIDDPEQRAARYLELTAPAPASPSGGGPPGWDQRPFNPDQAGGVPSSG